MSSVHRRTTVIGLVILAALSILRCSPAQDENAFTQSEATSGGPTHQTGEAVTCACGDQECWRKATNDGMKDQLECAKDAIEKVIPIVGPIADLAVSIADQQNGVDALSDVIAIVKEVLSARNKAAGFPNDLACMIDIANAFDGAIKPLKELEKSSKFFTESPSYENAKSMGDLLKKSYDAAVAFSNLIGRENQNCNVDQNKDEHKKWQEKLRTLKTKPRGFFDSFVNRSKDVVKSPIDKINVARTIYSCAARIFKGARTLYKNTQCLMADLNALAQSKKAVQRALAFEGSRQFNHAKYVGCTSCVYSSWRDSTETEYNNCRAKCEAKGAEFVPEGFPKKRQSWIVSCQATCGAAKTDGLFWDYTDEEACNEVKNSGAQSRHYRHVNITDVALPAPQRRAIAEEMRAIVVKNLVTVRDNYQQFRSAVVTSQEGGNDHIQQEDFEAVAESTSYSRPMREAGEFFGKFAVNGGWAYYFTLLETADAGFGMDGKVGTTDVQYFIDEISEYRDETEFD